MTKLLVGTGYNGTFLSNVEIVDLSSEKTVCQDLPEFPRLIDEQIGGFHDLTTPILCGGWTGTVKLFLLFFPVVILGIVSFGAQW